MSADPQHPTEVQELAMATRLFTAICEAVGPGFHPDHRFDDYVFGDERSYSDEAAAVLDAALSWTMAVFEANNLDPHLLGCMIAGLDVGDDPETWSES